MTRFPLVMVFGILLVSQTCSADTTWVAGGEVSGDWTVEHSPYIIQGDIQIRADQSLTIGAGVRVLISGAYSIMSAGQLTVQGTATDSVWFSPLLNSVGWRGLSLGNTQDTCRLDYCVVEGVANGSQAGGLTFYAIAVKLDHCTVRQIARSGVVAFGTNLTMNHCLITDCGVTGINMVGGGLILQSTLSANLTDCQIIGNSATDGGGIYAQGPLQLNLLNCDISGNRASLDGGGLFFELVSGMIQNCTFRQNSASAYGGGALIGWRSRMSLDGCVFDQDSAMQGAALFTDSDSTQLALTRCVFSRNVAGSNNAYGYGTIFIDYANGHAVLTMDRCTVVYNKVLHSGRACILGPVPILTNSILAFNRGGPTLGQFGTTFNVQYCAFFGNDANCDPGAPEQFGSVDEVNANGDSCDVYQNLFLNPLFADTVAADYHLTTESPCIDAGDPASPRDPDNTIADMGAYYFAHTLNAARDFIPYPLSLSLSSYPNPFNAQTEIRFELPQSGPVTLKVFDLLGREVETLLAEPLTMGSHVYFWNGSNQPSGVYFVRLVSEKIRATHKLLLLK